MSTIVPSTLAAANQATSATTGATERLRDAAGQFEAIFLRQILSALERTVQVGHKQSTTAESTYGSLVVQAVADSVAQAGGLGLVPVITSSIQASLARQTNDQPESHVPPASGSEGKP